MLSCLIQLIQLARLKPYGKLEGEDFREGLTAILSVKVAEPQFEGQTKTKLGNGDIKGIVDKVVYEGILDFLEQNPSIGRKVIEKALLAARSRSAAKKARELIRRKSALGGSSLPGKLADCSNRDPNFCELYLVEGPEVRVTIEVDDKNKATITTDLGEYDLMAKQPEEFPKTPEQKSPAVIKIPGKTLKQIINSTSFAISRDELKPALTGVLLQISSESNVRCTFVSVT